MEVLIDLIDKKDAFNFGLVIDTPRKQCPGVEIEDPIEGEPIAIGPSLEWDAVTHCWARYYDSPRWYDLDLVLFGKAKCVLNVSQDAVIKVSAESGLEPAEGKLRMAQRLMVPEQRQHCVAEPISVASIARRARAIATSAVTADEG